MANVSFGLARPPVETEPPGTEAFNATRFFQVPTPAPGTVAGLGIPLVTAVAHAPVVPADADPLTVTATITPAFSPVASAEMRYRVNFGTEVAVAMTGGPSGAWTAAIPPEASTPGQLVRYFVTATDAAGRTTRWPPYLDPLTQPQYQGTVVNDHRSPLPVYHWWVQNTAAAETVTGTRCSFFHNGVLYDNAFWRIRGGTSVSWPKKSYKIEIQRRV